MPPFRVTGIDQDISQLAVGTNRACGLGSRDVFCWPLRNFDPQGLGGGTSPATKIEGFPAAPSYINYSVARPGDKASTNFLAIANGEIYFWTIDVYRGNDYAQKMSPPNIPKELVSIVPTLQSSCVITREYEVWCWGGGQSGDLGDGSFTSSDSAVRVLPWAE